MFSRFTPGRDRETPAHDPLHVRIATAVVVLGLIATGVAVVWLDAGRSGTLLPGTAGAGLSGAPGAQPQRLARGSGQAGGAGLSLLREAAAACRTVSYQGVQFMAWRGAESSWTSMVDVSHQRNHQTLIRAAAAPVAPAVPSDETARAAIDSDMDADDAGQQDPEGIMDMTPQMVVLLAANYRVSVAGSAQVAGRPATVVRVRRSNGALAAQFWLDQGTKLPLRRETFDASARVVTEAVFLSLRLGAPASAGAPATGARPASKALTPAQLARLRAAGWPLPAALPGNLTLVQASETAGNPGPVVNLAYSDGLSVVSLFLQPGHLPAVLHGWSKVALLGQDVYAAGPDQRSVAWSARGYVYTLIADAPDQTVSQVIGALPHEGGTSFFVRVARGLRRLASWVNPFR